MQNTIIRAGAIVEYAIIGEDAEICKNAKVGKSPSDCPMKIIEFSILPLMVQPSATMECSIFALADYLPITSQVIGKMLVLSKVYGKQIWI